jgi:TonB family protein
MFEIVRLAEDEYEARRVEIGAREVSGFVQLSFTVQPDGTATDIRVFGAAPSGYYEEQAVERIRQRRWQPDFDADGRPVAREANEVIEFTVPVER